MEFNEGEELQAQKVAGLYNCVQIQLMHCLGDGCPEVFSPNIRFKTTDRTNPVLCLQRHLK